ncbi:hypothetical protein TPA0908_17420 [Micromonospora sp. AKA38]|nr:hypothetical protein TPA0908_17420 [Micromonospora sp. AKA38]
MRAAASASAALTWLCVALVPRWVGLQPLGAGFGGGGGTRVSVGGFGRANGAVDVRDGFGRGFPLAFALGLGLPPIASTAGGASLGASAGASAGSSTGPAVGSSAATSRTGRSSPPHPVTVPAASSAATAAAAHRPTPRRIDPPRGPPSGAP